MFDCSQWSNFQNVINRATITCEEREHEVKYDFAEVSKIVEKGFIP